MTNSTVAGNESITPVKARCCKETANTSHSPAPYARSSRACLKLLRNENEATKGKRACSLLLLEEEKGGDGVGANQYLLNAVSGKEEKPRRKCQGRKKLSICENTKEGLKAIKSKTHTQQKKLRKDRGEKEKKRGANWSEWLCV